MSLSSAESSNNVDSDGELSFYAKSLVFFHPISPAHFVSFCV